MKIAIMQPYFFPYLGYFQLIAAVDKFVIYDDVNYINKGWINRNNILINGKSSLINVPLSGASQNKRIKDIAPSTEQKWRNSLLKTIEHNYKRAPHFDEVYKMLQGVINSDIGTISEFNYLGIKCVCEYLGITTTIIPGSERYLNSNLKGQYRILDICQKENAKHYINPTGGMELYNRGVFLNEGVSLSFIKSELTCYKQFKGDFIPALSIIDALMFCDVNELKLQLIRFSLE
jgi:hypothetical protein